MEFHLLFNFNMVTALLFQLSERFFILLMSKWNRTLWWWLITWFTRRREMRCGRWNLVKFLLEIDDGRSRSVIINFRDWFFWLLFFLIVRRLVLTSSISYLSLSVSCLFRLLFLFLSSASFLSLLLIFKIIFIDKRMRMLIIRTILNFHIHKSFYAWFDLIN